jgi:hypothetical protein
MQFNSIQLNSMLLLESVSCNTTLIVTMTVRCHNKPNDETATTTTNDRDDEDDGNATVLHIHPFVQYIVVMGDYSNGVRHVWRRASPKQHNLESVMRSSVFGMVAMCCGVEWSGAAIIYYLPPEVLCKYAMVLSFLMTHVGCGAVLAHVPTHLPIISPDPLSYHLTHFLPRRRVNRRMGRRRRQSCW